jgi:hypothetical protein
MEQVMTTANFSSFLTVVGIDDTLINSGSGQVAATNAALQATAAATGLFSLTPATAPVVITANSIALGSAIETLTYDASAGNIKEAIGDGLSVIGDSLGVLGGVVSGVGLIYPPAALAGKVIEELSGVVNGIGILLNSPETVSNIETALGEMDQEINETVNGITGSLQSTFSAVGSGAINYFNSIAGNISSEFGALSDLVQNAGTAAINSAAISLSNITDSTESALAGLYDSSGVSAPSIIDTISNANTFSITNDNGGTTIATGSVSTDNIGDITGTVLTNNGATIDQIQSVGSDGSLATETQGYTSSNALQYSASTTISSDGQVSATFAGQGAVDAFSNASIYLSGGAQATIYGGNNIITGGDDVILTLDSNTNYISLGSGSVVTVNASDDLSYVSDYNSDGSTITSTYTGQNGSGDLVSEDVENANGTSQLTVYAPDGSFTSTSYSGPSGTGSIISTISGAAGTEGFEGQQLSLGVYYPDLTPSELSAYGVATVGPEVEFPSVAALATGYSPPGTFLVDTSVDITPNTITLSYPTSEEGTEFLGASFNGFVFTVLNPNAPVISSVSIVESDIVGFASSDVIFTADTIDINVSGLSLPDDAAGSLELSVSFASSSPPAGDLTLNGTNNPSGSTITGVNGSGSTLQGTIENNGVLSVDSTGAPTEFAALGNTAINGSGVIEMSDSAQNAIYGPLGSGATLTFGSGQTVEGSGLIADNGDGSIVNDGAILANQSTPLTVSAPTTNGGSIKASGGSVYLTGAVSGNGSFTVSAGSTLEFDSSVSTGQTITMVGPGATLILDDAADFAGTITGFGTGDIVEIANLSITGGVPVSLMGSGGMVTLWNAEAAVMGTDAVTFSGTGDSLTLAQESSGTLSGFTSGDTITLAAPAYKSSYEAAFYAMASGGTLEILDTANGDAVVAALPFSGSFAGEAFTLSADPVAGTDVTLSAAPWANPQAGDVLFTDAPGQAYSAYQYDYAPGGSFIGSQFYYTGITSEPYTGEEIDYNGAGQLTRAAFSGVSGQPYSSYEYDYAGGVFSGASYTFTSVPAGASYSSYVVDESPSNSFASEQFYFTNVTGQPYTGEEEDFNANVQLTRVVLTGVQNQAYSALELDYTAGTYEGYKAYYTGITGQAYTAEEADVSTSNQLEKVIYSGLTATPYSSVEQDYASGTLSDVIYSFTNVTGQPYYAYQVEETPGGSGVQETLDLASGGHDLIALASGQTLTSLGLDMMTGSASGATSFVLNAIYGQDTITNLTAADTVSLPTAEFASFNALLGAAQNQGANVVITAGDGDTLTLNNMTKTQLTGMAANFTFHG